MGNNFKKRKFIGISFALFFILILQVSFSENIFVSDDFNDNSLNLSLWKSVVEDSSSFSETNQEAWFSVNTQRSVLHSKAFDIYNWTYINISGEWKFTNPNTAEMRCRIIDYNSGEYAGVYYATWTTYAHEHIRYYWNSSSNAIYEDRAIPRNYVNFTIWLNRSVMQYWENGALIKETNSDVLSNSTGFYIEIGGYDASSGIQNIYFNWINVSSDGTNSSNVSNTSNSSLVINVTNPEEENASINVSYVNITITTNNNLTNATLEWNGVNESMDGSGKNWYKFKSELGDGTYNYRIYAHDIYNNTNSTGNRSILVDTIVPVYSNVSQDKNKTYAGEGVNVSAYWYDVNLESALLEVGENIEGSISWEDYDDVDELSKPNAWTNFTITPDEEDVGKTFCWRITAYDLASNSNTTTYDCFYVAERLDITDYQPDSKDVENLEGSTRIFNITLNQDANISWYLNGTSVKNETNVSTSDYVANLSMSGKINISVLLKMKMEIKALLGT